MEPNGQVVSKTTFNWPFDRQDFCLPECAKSRRFYLTRSSTPTKIKAKKKDESGATLTTRKPTTTVKEIGGEGREGVENKARP